MTGALAEVLGALTTESDVVWWRVMLTDHPTRLTSRGVEWSIVPGVWRLLRMWSRETLRDGSSHTITPAEAVEALHAAVMIGGS